MIPILKKKKTSSSGWKENGKINVQDVNLVLNFFILLVGKFFFHTNSGIFVTSSSKKVTNENEHDYEPET